MNNLIEESDLNDPVIRAQIHRTELVAGKAKKLIVSKYKKLPPEQQFNAIANTIGILAAELVRLGGDIGGAVFAKAMNDLVSSHTNRAVDQIVAMEDGKSERKH